MAYRISIPRMLNDFILLALLAIGLLCLDKLGKPYIRGYYCDDDSIRYPYKPDTVSRLVCAVVGGGIAIFIIIIFEVVRVLRENRDYDQGIRDQLQYQLHKWKIHRIFPRLWLFLGFFLFGAVINQSIADVGKFTIGRLRPHFLDVCKPNVTICTSDSATKKQEMSYITQYRCTADPVKWDHELRDSRLSFPSGHAAFSFYTMIFAILYLQSRVYFPLWSRMGRPIIQTLCLAWAVYVALSRISDYKHHWSDVFAGAILGTFCATVVVWPIGRFFERRELPPDYSPRRIGEPGDVILMEPMNSGGAHNAADDERFHSSQQTPV